MKDIQKKNSYVLWLPSWYPNKITPYDGDFIQRHARAVSAFVQIHVIHFIKDLKGVVTESIYIDEKTTGNLTETIVYYNVKDPVFKFINKINSLRTFKKLFKKIINELFEKAGRPQLVHVHVAFKAGIIARWIRKRFKIPYLLTEHWTIYLDEATPNLKDLSFVHRAVINKVVKDALLVLPVSDYLGKCILKKFSFISYKVLPNVVDAEIFYPCKKIDNHFQLIHASALDYQKDPQKLFEAIGLLKKKGIKFTLNVFGPANAYIRELLKKEMIEEEVILHGEVPQPELANYMRRSDALILYSRYETFGCVIIEANASGIPVIASDIPVMHELISADNGVLIKPNDPKALACGLEEFILSKDKFDSERIAIQAKEKFSYPVVGKKLSDLYEEIFNHQSTF